MMTLIHTTLKKNGAVVLTLILAFAMIGMALRTPQPSSAAGLVCGDGDLEDPEQCDDGNLQSGDGCSSACTIELCGNLSIDRNEQCDDGNLQNNDGCNRYCQIEFCGDRVIQETQGEQCDDGNGISGDGCSGGCQMETSHEAAPPPPIDAPPPPPKTTPSPVIIQAILANTFLTTQAGEDYKKYLDDDEIIKLETIMQKLVRGKRLNEQERLWAAELMTVFEKAKADERARYTDLLKQFIASPISSDVVEEKGLEKSNLVDVEVPIAIEELERAVNVIRRGELVSAVTVDVSRLKRQGIDLASDMPVGYRDHLTSANRPIVVFTTLKALKEAAEKYASTNVPASLETIRSEAESLKEALPVFEREYGVEPQDIEPLLTAIETISQESTKKDLDRVIAAFNRFVATLERRNVLTKGEIAFFGADSAHAAAAARMADSVGLGGELASADTVTEFLDELVEAAPADAKHSFESGGIGEQRDALLKLFEDDERSRNLRAALREDGRTDFDNRYDVLRSQIEELGETSDTLTPCDDSVSDALSCVNQYYADLQDAVRGRSFMSRVIGTLQDFFNIGS